MSKFPNIPLDAIRRGRDTGKVLEAFMDFHKDAAGAGKTDEKIFADAMQGAVYRLYLLGVEDDGMKGGAANG